LALVLLALRLPLLDHPWPVQTPDEEGFVAAVGFPADYPVHHPGYPLWIAMGTALHALGLAPYAAYQAWSVFASVLLPLVLYWGLARLVDDGLAWWVAAALGVNPLLWFQATTALTYPAAGLVALVVVVLIATALLRRGHAAFLVACLLLAIGASLRPDLVLFLGPLVAYTAWHFRWKAAVAGLCLVVAGAAASIAASAFLYGRAGPSASGPSLSHTADVLLGTSVFRLGLVDGLLRNAVKVLVNVGWDFGAAVIVLVPALVRLIVRRRRQPTRPGPSDRNGTGESEAVCDVASASAVRGFLVLWTVPLLAFLLLIHVVQGYFMLLLPAGFCVVAWRLQGWGRPRRSRRVAAAIAVCSLLQFALYPWSAESSGVKRLLDAKIAFQSAAGLRQIDRWREAYQPGDFWHTSAHDAEGAAQEAGGPGVRRTGDEAAGGRDCAACSPSGRG